MRQTKLPPIANYWPPVTGYWPPSTEHRQRPLTSQASLLAIKGNTLSINAHTICIDHLPNFPPKNSKREAPRPASLHLSCPPSLLLSCPPSARGWRLPVWVFILRLHPSAFRPPLPALPHFPRGSAMGNQLTRFTAITWVESIRKTSRPKNQKREALSVRALDLGPWTLDFGLWTVLN